MAHPAVASATCRLPSAAPTVLRPADPASPAIGAMAAAGTTWHAQLAVWRDRAARRGTSTTTTPA